MIFFSEISLNYNQMIALCRGTKTDIKREINAYHDMDEYYIVGAMNYWRFSSLINLCALLAAGVVR